jgi:hypothetical protein
MAAKFLGLKNGFASVKRFFVSYKKVFFVLSILAALAYVGVLFYFYAWQVSTPEALPNRAVSIDSTLYQKVMDELNQREINFAQEEGRTYSDPFYR